jgi:cleavage and polyadenylation specificity factor subunit 3
MTAPTKAIYNLNVLDYIRVSSGENKLFEKKDVDNSMKKIEIIDYHQDLEFNGIRFTCFNAGHVLGAAMFLVDIDGIKILYTGDYSREEDKHIQPAEIPNIKIDILIVESTFGANNHNSRQERE